VICNIPEITQTYRLGYQVAIGNFKFLAVPQDTMQRDSFYALCFITQALRSNVYQICFHDSVWHLCILETMPNVDAEKQVDIR